VKLVVEKLEKSWQIIWWFRLFFVTLQSNNKGGMGPPDVAGPLDNIIPQKTLQK